MVSLPVCLAHADRPDIRNGLISCQPASSLDSDFNLAQSRVQTSTWLNPDLNMIQSNSGMANPFRRSNYQMKRAKRFWIGCQLWQSKVQLNVIIWSQSLLLQQHYWPMFPAAEVENVSSCRGWNIRKEAAPDTILNRGFRWSKSSEEQGVIVTKIRSSVLSREGQSSLGLKQANEHDESSRALEACKADQQRTANLCLTYFSAPLCVRSSFANVVGWGLQVKLTLFSWCLQLNHLGL